jgi:hypothetical protein
MNKQRKSAAELAGMERAESVKAPRTVERFQHSAEKMAEGLRGKYDLVA